MNGYTNHNNKIMNGNSVKSCIRNGYIASHSHINITNNPLATESKHEKVSIFLYLHLFKVGVDDFLSSVLVVPTFLCFKRR